MIVGEEINGIRYSAEEIENLINDWEKGKQTREDIIIMLFPTILLQLLLRNKIDLSKINDSEYLVRKVANFNEEIGFENAFYVITVVDDFIETAKYAKESNRNNVAVVLIATAIEHMLNIYYRYFMRLNNFNDEAITQMIRSSKFVDKIGWLMLLVFKMELDPDLKNKLIRIIDLRNAIVHYKAVPFVLSENDDGKCSADSIKKDLKILDFDILEIPEKLEKTLRAQLPKLYPQTKLVEEMMEVILEHKTKVRYPEDI